MRKLLTAIGRFVVGLFCRVGRFGIFSWTLLMRLGGARLSHVVLQIHFIGNYSLLIIAVSGLFVGFVLGLQGYYVLVTYGSEQALGTMVALSLVRELGPAVTALLFAGRAGTALTAEIGLMRAGEQLAAMEMMGVDPVRRVLAPRFIGAFVAMPVLATIFSAVGIMGAWFVGVEMIGTDGGAFWSQMQSAVDVWHDIGNGSSRAWSSALPSRSSHFSTGMPPVRHRKASPEPRRAPWWWLRFSCSALTSS